MLSSGFIKISRHVGHDPPVSVRNREKIETTFSYVWDLWLLPGT